MALDKQRILNELGSVMNQLQSADCGCLDKLFTNPGQPSPAGGNHMANYGSYNRHGSHGQGCCHHHGSYNSPCAGEPHTINANPIGRCNPSKLYADTYSYLNQNLMQPIVKDVYNDLKNLTPANTMANNPMAGQMGLSIQDNANSMAGEMSYSRPNNNANLMTNYIEGNQMQSMPTTPGMRSQIMGNIAGMGPHIVNMMIGDGKSKPSNMEAQGGALTGPMVIDAPNSPHGQVGVTPLNQSNGNNQAQFIPAMEASYATQGYPISQPQNQNMYDGVTRLTNTQMNSNVTNMAQNNPNTLQSGNMNSNPAAQQINAAQNNTHGMHSQGVAKFNEMFPGVMQGLGGDLGFDPMAIAIQMNPAHQQKIAMDTMQKIMNGTNLNKSLNLETNSGMQSAINGAKVASASFARPVSAHSQNISAINRSIANDSGRNQQVISKISQNQPQSQQNIYTAITGNPSMNLQEIKRCSQLSQQEPVSSQAQHKTDPRHITAPHFMPENNERSIFRDSSFETYDQNSRHELIKDPIFPVDTVSPSLMKTKYFEYNTLGQPVEILPAKMYHTQEPNLPQTLSPQPPFTRKREDHMKYSNVKSTVSKTSLVPNKPIGIVPSRNQLQHIYNQYKGSQSFTQQNIRASTHGGTHSEGHIAADYGNSSQRHAPVERVGDVIVNNAAEQKVEQVIGHIGDAPEGKRRIPGDPAKVATGSRLRNGLQDMVYTSYPTSAAWSFHGHNYPPYYSGRRTRHRT